MAKSIEFNKSISPLSTEELQARLAEDKVRLRKLEFAHALSPLQNPMSIRSLRKDIARLQTQLKTKSLG